MICRVFIRVALALTCTVLVSGSSQESQPNIIVMVADDVGYGDLYSYDKNTGQERNEIDVMAEEGVKFTQWNAGGPMCTPSRASLLTGEI